MKKILFLLLPFWVILVATNCKKNDDPGTLKIRFVPTYEGKALYMDKPLVYANNLPLKFQRLSFFTEILDGTNSLSPTQKIDFSEIYDEKAAQNGVSVELSMPVGTYSNLNLSVGVNKGNNAKSPADFTKTNVLSEVGDYWDSWKSYIFTKTEGKIDQDKSGKYAEAFSYHTGTDEMFRSIPLGKTVTISSLKTTELVIEIDARKILDSTAGTIDPIKDQNAHSLANKPVALKIMDNYKTAVTVK
jgi:hypothetical protein